MLHIIHKLILQFQRSDRLKSKSFNPDNLFVEFRDGATRFEPVFNRKYTLTHSDLTAELFLTIGLEYAYDKVGLLRDEVISEWRGADEYPFLFVYVYINGKMNPIDTAKRDEIFRRELPLALQAIYYGDRVLLETYPDLKDAPIWIYFDSQNPQYKRLENWGVLEDYKVNKIKDVKTRTSYMVQKR